MKPKNCLVVFELVCYIITLASNYTIPRHFFLIRYLDLGAKSLMVKCPFKPLYAFVFTLQELANCQAVILSVEDDAGQRIVIEDLLEATRSSDVGMRQAAAIILNIYCAKTKADYSAHLRSLMSGLLRLFNDTNSLVLSESWDALNSITKVSYFFNKKDVYAKVRIYLNVHTFN